MTDAAPTRPANPRRTAQGRVATELSYKKLGLKAATGNQSKLF